MTDQPTFDNNLVIPLHSAPAPAETESNGNGRLETAENWYAEPFNKRTGCKTPGQCGGDCDCGCPYNTMTEVERLPLIETVAAIFPNEWLAFIISPDEDQELEPLHGKLVAHSPDPDEVYDAVNTVLWNQHVYIFFNGDFDTLKQSYGSTWKQAPGPVARRSYSGPKQINDAAQAAGVAPLPDTLVDLIYSAIDQLYETPNINEASRRLRLARVRAANAGQQELMTILDEALDQLEIALPRVNTVIWVLEEAMAALEPTPTPQHLQG